MGNACTVEGKCRDWILEVAGTRWAAGGRVPISCRFVWWLTHLRWRMLLLETTAWERESCLHLSAPFLPISHFCYLRALLVLLIHLLVGLTEVICIIDSLFLGLENRFSSQSDYKPSPPGSDAGQAEAGRTGVCECLCWSSLQHSSAKGSAGTNVGPCTVLQGLKQTGEEDNGDSRRICLMPRSRSALICLNRVTWLGGEFANLQSVLLWEQLSVV